MPVVMLAIERSERVSITTGIAGLVKVAGGDPFLWVVMVVRLYSAWDC